MRIILDLDDTLSRTKNRDWQNSQPIADVCCKVREIQEKMPDAEIYIHTARGMNSCKGDAHEAERRNRPNIENFLSKNGIKVDGIIFGKPLGDLYVDDKAMSADEFANSDVRTYEGLSGAKVWSIGRMVVKECADAAEQAEWYEKARQIGIPVPRVLCTQLGRIYMERVKGEVGASGLLVIVGALEYIDCMKAISLDGKNDSKGYAEHCSRRAEEAGVAMEEGLKDFICNCYELRARTFCHGDMTLQNMIWDNGKLTLIDPCQRAEMSHWLLDASKLRASLNWLDYGLTGNDKPHGSEIVYFDESFSRRELEIIKALEKTHFYRVYRYAVVNGRKDVAERLSNAFEKRKL